MSAIPLTDTKACVFDAYGTLFDFAAATRRCNDELGEQVAKLAALWRDKQLQYTWLRATQALHADFWQVTGDALDFARNPGDRASAAARPADGTLPNPGRLSRGAGGFEEAESGGLADCHPLERHAQDA